MKIDLHCHTKKTKQGDNESRNVDFDLFERKIQDADVKVLAITNHNHFDYEQYLQFSESQFSTVWPGVELDVSGTNGKYHCIIIVNPKEAGKFNQICKNEFKNKSPDNYLISAEDLVNIFSELDSIFLVHYLNKEPSIHDEDLDFLQERLTDKNALLLEPSSLKSAGIMVAHGLRTIIGSDVKDWNNYEEYELPQLKLPVSDFDKFKLLLKKDKSIIKTFLDQKNYELVTIQPFLDLKLTLEIYNDVNVIIGGKGTGKTEILKSMEKVFQDKGNNDVISYYAAENKIKYKELIEIKPEQNDINVFDLDNQSLDLKILLDWTIPNATNTQDYYNWKAYFQPSKNFGFMNSDFAELISDVTLNKWKSVYKEIRTGIKQVLKHEKEIEEVAENELENFKNILNIVDAEIRKKLINEYCKWWSLKLEKTTINKMKSIYQSKKGEYPKPSNTGFNDFFVKHIGLKKKISEIKTILDMGVEKNEITIGNLPDKGRIYVEKNISLNPDNFDGESKFILGQGYLRKLQNLKKSIIDLESNVFTISINETLSEVKKQLNEMGINNLDKFLGVSSKVKKGDGSEYSPSTGEQSMLILNNVLIQEGYNVFILDEPELSVGNEYINNIIVPRLKELSNLNKKIIIATHDANIGVRTLPLQTIYRVDKGSNKYETFLGNPFTDNLVCYGNESNVLNWSEVTLKVLEGGRNAFNERGVIYGDKRN